MLGGPLPFVGGVSGSLPRVRDRVGGRDRGLGLIVRGCCGGDLRCGSGLHPMHSDDGAEVQGQVLLDLNPGRDVVVMIVMVVRVIGADVGSSGEWDDTSEEDKEKKTVLTSV